MCVYCASRRSTAMMRSTSSETTAAMKADVLLMEKRLVALRERMASARHPQNPVCLSLRFKPHADPSPETSVSQVAQRGCEELQSDRGNLGKCTD